MQEVEWKFLVDAPQALRDRARALGWECLPSCNQVDVYYDQGGQMKGSDCALRIRWDGNRGELTYKGPKASNSGVKARLEQNVALRSTEDCAHMNDVLASLGYTPQVVLSKTRESWRGPGIGLDLDQVAGLPLIGELEVLSDDTAQAEATIRDAAMQLGISDPTSISTSTLEFALAAGVIRSESPKNPFRPES